MYNIYNTFTFSPKNTIYYFRKLSIIINNFEVSGNKYQATINCLPNWQNDWATDLKTDQPTNKLINWLTDQFMNWSKDQLMD